MLVEIAPPVVTQEMRDEISRHLRLSTGFAGDSVDEAEAAFRAAISHLEAQLGLCLIPRRFTWRTALGDDGTALAAISPLRAIVSAARVSRDGGLDPLNLALFSLNQGAVRTRICSTSRIFGQIEFTLDAGFGDEWAATPAGLRRAALVLTAEFHDRRHDSAPRREAPSLHGVAALIRPWRPIRLGAGAL